MHNSMPFNIGLVVSVNGNGKVQGILDDFSGAGVKHRCLIGDIDMSHMNHINAINRGKRR